MQPVKVRVLHLSECPATPATVRLVEEVARALGVSITLESTLVETAEQAQALAFLGSPTVQVEGRDIEPEARVRQDFGVTWRTYGVSGIPPEDLIRAALKDATSSRWVRARNRGPANPTTLAETVRTLVAKLVQPTMPPLRPKSPGPTRPPMRGAATIIRPRIGFGPTFSLGPGKIDLLRAVTDGGSISAAARALGLSYKRAWLLIDTLNRGFGRPVVERSVGGRGGGGARLTALGAALLRRYDAIEAACQKAAAAELAALRRLVSAAR